jgi:hypothetical protein
MLRRRPRRAASSWVGHPAVGLLCLGVLYLTATVVTVLLAFHMTEVWPVLLAAAMALVTMLCAIAAWRRF